MEFSKVDEVKRGEPARASQLNAIIRAVKENAPIAGVGVRVRKSPLGTIIEATQPVKDRKTRLDKAVLCKITGGDTRTGYTVEIYENGLSGEGKTYNGRLFCVELALEPTLPVGSFVIGHTFTTGIVAGE